MNHFGKPVNHHKDGDGSRIRQASDEVHSDMGPRTPGDV